MQSFGVNTAQVSALSGEIRKGANDIRSDLENLDQKIGVLRSRWGGEAQASYDEAQRRWNQSLAEMQSILEQIAVKTQEIADGYTATDTNAAKRFSI
jgi:WXG100 family type VII secretion target